MPATQSDQATPQPESDSEDAPYLFYPNHPAYQVDGLFRIGIKCCPPLERAEQWVLPYAVISRKIAVAEEMRQENEYGLPNQDAVNHFAFTETRPPFIHAELRMLLQEAAVMQALMGGAFQATITDPKITLHLSDITQRDWGLKAQAEAKAEQQRIAAEERRAQWADARFIIIKHNPYPGVPPMTIDRATSMLAAEFSYTLEVTYRQQHVRGVTVAGLATNQVQAWVGPPLAANTPSMLQDTELGFAKWEFTFAIPDPAACTRCHQVWTPCATKNRWQACQTHLYHQKQRQRQLRLLEGYEAPTRATRSTRARPLLTLSDVTTNSAALQRALNLPRNR